MARTKRNSHNFLVRALDFLMLVLTLLLALALLLAYFAPLVNPNRIIWFAYLGLAAPLIYVADLFLLLYWAMRWRFIAFFPFVLLIAGLGHVSKYLKIPVKQQYETSLSSAGEALRIMSYNVSGFWGGGEDRKSNRMGEIMDFIRRENPAILCMQEFEVNRINTRHRFDSVMESLPYHRIYPAVEVPEGGWGLALYSRYRILRSGKIPFENSNNSAMWVDLAVGRDTVRVFNCHLQTTGVDEADREFLRLETGITDDSLRLDKSKGIARKLARNYRSRAIQADTLASRIHNGTPLVIVCGDFNDTPMSYVYHRIRGDFDDAFQQKGRGMVSTYRGMRGLFRIDYLFYSGGFEALDYRTEQLRWSDHNPVVVDLARHKK